jgi:uncharacterized protein DUF4389
MSAGRIIALVAGCIVALVAAGLLAAGGVFVWAYTTQRDDDGFYTTRSEPFSSPGYAIRSDDLDLGTDEGAEWLFEPGRLGTIRIRGESEVPSTQIFLGIGRRDDVERYLRGVPHDVLVDVDIDPFRTTYRRVPGRRPPAPPTSQTFWAASGTGEVEWKVEQGNWVAVAMNSDGSLGVSADISVAAKSGLVLWAMLIVLVLGLLFGALAAFLIVLGARGTRAPPPAEAAALAATTEAAPGAAPAYPLFFEGELETGLSRWLWLVKWLLLIPHLIVLAFLWIALWVTTIVAFFAILFTARYPRSLFVFAEGVLRWTWRVAWYGYGGLATDRYPPFTLADTDYPARLSVPYPERLSRGLVLVKWWLLAIPHYLVVAVFLGWGFGWGYDHDHGHSYPGLILLLVFFAAIVLLFRNRYPRSLYELVLGMDRWVARVAVYVLLLRDEYPPFRLDR